MCTPSVFQICPTSRAGASYTSPRDGCHCMRCVLLPTTVFDFVCPTLHCQFGFFIDLLTLYTTSPTLLARPSHVLNTLCFDTCPCHSVRNSVVLVMPTAALVDTVILSQPLPAPIRPPHSWTCLSPGGGASLPTPLHPRLTLTTPSKTSPTRLAISGPPTRLESACVCLPVCMCELNLLRVTSLHMHASELLHTPANVFSARHTGTCVCVCASGKQTFFPS